MPPPPQLVVMGVSGSGKSTVGAALAQRLGLPFVDADDLHPITNVDKMTAGIPLTDDDRWPWLAKVGEAMAAAADTGVVVACSALKHSYRDAIRSGAPAARFVLLSGSRELLESRLSRREGHFMPASLLESQLATLEPLDSAEGIVVSIEGAPGEIVDRVYAALDQLSE
jgi:carbohydrate kinase (thermoresistant glucokinase family)